jgi:hypothetical protein
MNKGFDQAAAFQKLRDVFHFCGPMSSVLPTSPFYGAATGRRLQ